MKSLTVKPNDEWRNKLSSQQYYVLREGGTEFPFTGRLLHNEESGLYLCGACGSAIFSSKTKFDSGTGWPSFFSARKGSVRLIRDDRLWMKRIEVKCSKCGGHLGHLFHDAPQTPTGKRFCINSAAMNFKSDLGHMHRG